VRNPKTAVFMDLGWMKMADLIVLIIATDAQLRVNAFDYFNFLQRGN
jgi:hypothetical protein